MLFRSDDRLRARLGRRAVDLEQGGRGGSRGADGHRAVERAGHPGRAGVGRALVVHLGADHNLQRDDDQAAGSKIEITYPPSKFCNIIFTLLNLKNSQFYPIYYLFY